MISSVSGAPHNLHATGELVAGREPRRRLLHGGHVIRKVRFRVLALAALAVLAAHLARAQEIVQAGTVKIGRPLRYVGESEKNSRCQLRIEQGSEGPYLVLASRDGKELVRELAIVQERKGKTKKARVWVDVLGKAEHLLRIMVIYGEKRYLAYFELAA